MDKSQTARPIKCSACGADIDVDITKETATCSFCKTCYSVSDLLSISDSEVTERLKMQAKQEIENKKLDYEIEKEREKAKKEEYLSFKKSKFSKVLLICSVVTALASAIAFSDSKIMSGLIAMVQFLLFLGAWLMGMNVIKEKKNNLKVLMTVVSFVLIIPFFAFSGGSEKRKENESFNWESIVLSEYLPKPESNKGHIYSNTQDTLAVEISNSSESDYQKYVNECKEKGFNIDTEASEDNYKAYNDEGYSLSISFSEYSEEYRINFDVPVKRNDIQWPSSEIGKSLPVPKSLKGEFEWEYEDNFCIKIVDTPINDFKKYIQDCFDKGYKSDYQKGEDFYRAYSDDGYYVSVDFIRFNTMQINVKTQEKDVETEKSTTTTSTSTKAPEPKTEKSEASEKGLRPDFKKAMDSYEKFMNEYVEFMKKYEKSNGSDLSLLSDYSKYLTEYSKMVEDFDNWKSNDLTDEEMDYYLKVQTRVLQKLNQI